MRQLILKLELRHIEVDSAGTAGHCVGNSPDHRSMQVALELGITLNHKARQLNRKDFTLFDHILVMDEANLESVRRLASDDFERSKISLITDYDPTPDRLKIVADPYYSDVAEFQRVGQQLLQCCNGWLVRMT